VTGDATAARPDRVRLASPEVGTQESLVRNRSVSSRKLSIPIPARDVVSRDALHARLDAGNWRLATVSAPAGFGKTMLLASWAATCQDDVAWYSCDSTDAEPVRFWTGLITCLERTWPDVGQQALADLRRTGSEVLESLISVAGDLEEVGTPQVLVVDDLHLARPSPKVLAAFVAALPVDTRLVIASRLPAPFATSRARLAGALLELRADDLRFTAEEAAALLQGNDVELEGDELDLLQQSTEGWPAAIQLAAASLGGSDDRSAFLDALASTDRALTDFLVSEVLDDLSERAVAFLSATCVLDEFDIALCDRLTGFDDAGAILDQLRRLGMFVVALDESGTWYRYHHLFGTFMRARIRAEDLQRFRRLHHDAAKALEDRGLVVAAVRAALAVDSGDRAATMVRRALTANMYPADVEVSAAAARWWLHERGAEAVRTDPVLVLEVVLALVMTTGGDDVLRWVQQVEAHHPNPPATTYAYLHGVWAEHHLVRGDVDEAGPHVDAAFAVFDGAPPRDGLFPLLHPLRVRYRLARGDLDGARAALDQVLTASTGHRVLDLVRLPAMRAWVAYLDGELRLAERLAREALARADDWGLGEHEPGRVFGALALAGVDAERADDVAHSTAVAAAHRSADVSGRPGLQATVALGHAAMARATGDVDVAAAQLGLARALVPDASRVVTEAFDREEALQALAFRPWDVPPLLDRLDESPATSVVRAALCVELGDGEGALAALATLPMATPRERVERGMLAALASRDVEAATEVFAGVLAAGEPEGFVRSIVGHGPAAAKLLDAVPAGRHDAYLAMLRTAGTAVVAPVRHVPPTTLIDPLSPSELNVLRYLSTRLTNREIAGALYISVNTLKTHVRSVYRKLGVASRADAVDAARKARLL
jgi:LuxR family maltose regulon positive regulatory protein